MQSDGIDILVEDGPLLALNKPAGLPTQAPSQFDSLEKRVRQFLAARAGADWAYVGVPHRLDRPVSGVILFTTKRRAAFKLSRQLEHRVVEKVYRARVAGRVSPDSGTWTDHLRKVYGQPRTEVVAETDPGAQLAVLHYRTVAYDATTDTSELEIKLETGRTHQIRVQSATRGHPVVGDVLYGSTHTFGPAPAQPTEPVTPEAQSHEERSRPIALHAWSITFRDPTTNEFRTITAPFPSMWHR